MGQIGDGLFQSGFILPGVSTDFFGEIDDLIDPVRQFIQFGKGKVGSKAHIGFVRPEKQEPTAYKPDLTPVKYQHDKQKQSSRRGCQSPNKHR